MVQEPLKSLDRPLMRVSLSNSILYYYKKKTWKGNMIKKYFKKKGRMRHLTDSHLYTWLKQKESDGNWWYRSFQSTLWLSSAIDVYIYFHGTLSAPEMSINVSQVGVALFLSFYYCYYYELTCYELLEFRQDAYLISNFKNTLGFPTWEFIYITSNGYSSQGNHTVT